MKADARFALDKNVGGVLARELAATYGTPVFAIDLDALDLEIDRILRACEPYGVAVGYAGKAFLCAAFAEHLAATPLRLDVCSLGELVTAERGGFPANRMYFHGCGKTDDEMRAIVERRVAFDVIDNAEELERLAALAQAGEPVDVMLRLNTGIEAHTHAFIRTGGENTKFGVPAGGVEDVLRRIAALPQLRLIGLHAHVGSQIADPGAFLTNLDELLTAAGVAARLGLPVAELICGGGIGVEEGPDDPRPIEIERLVPGLAERAAGSGLRIAIEPGRAIVARAGTSLYTVMAVKAQGRRRFVILDGGLADNPAADALRRATRRRGHGRARGGSRRAGDADRPLVRERRDRRLRPAARHRGRRPDCDADHRRLHLQHGEQLQPVRPPAGRLRPRRASSARRARRIAGRRRASRHRVSARHKISRAGRCQRARATVH